MRAVRIRGYVEADWSQVWPIVRAEETFPARGYAGMQFNAVVESNHSALELYKRHGFSVVGTVPGALAHPTLGRVGLHVMYRVF